MPFLNSYVCPKCSNPFPFFIGPSMRIRRGLLAPDLKCPKCGQIFRQKIDIPSAAWIWPLAIGFLAGMIYSLRRFIYHESPVLYMLIVIALFGPFFIVLRKGRKLVPIEETLAWKSGTHKWIIPISCILLGAFSLGYYTQDWLNVILGISIGLVVWAFYYYFSAKGK